MITDYRVKDKYVIRLEYFGGLLLSSRIEDRYVLDHQSTVFLLALKKYEYSDALYIVEIVFNEKYSPNMSELLDYEIIECVERCREKSTRQDLDIFASQIKESISKVHNLKSLSFPLYISIYPSSACQLSCEFCYFHDKAEQYYDSKMHSDLKIWKKVIDEAAEKGLLGLSILGGEPTLYNHIDELLQYTQYRNVNTSLTTNGVFIKPSTFDIICNYQSLVLSISLQAVGAINRQLMGIDSEKIIKTIKKFVRHGKTPQINTVVTKQSLDDYKALLDFCDSEGIEDVFFNIYNTIGNKHEKTFSEYKKLDYMLQDYIEKKQYKMGMSFVGCLYYSAYYDELDNPITSEFDNFLFGCEAAKSKMEIMPNGDAVPCVMLDSQNDSIQKQTIEDIWLKSSLFNSIRTFENKNAFCRRCKFLNFCNGGCPAQSNNEILKPDRIDSRCEVYRNKIL